MLSGRARLPLLSALAGIRPAGIPVLRFQPDQGGERRLDAAGARLGVCSYCSPPGSAAARWSPNNGANWTFQCGIFIVWYATRRAARGGYGDLPDGGPGYGTQRAVPQPQAFQSAARADAYSCMWSRPMCRYIEAERRLQGDSNLLPACTTSHCISASGRKWTSRWRYEVLRCARGHAGQR